MSHHSNYINVENTESVNIICNNLERSSSQSSTSSNSTLSTSDVKRRKRFDYFCGDGDLVWEPKLKLTIQDTDVTAHLNSYRKRNIRIANISNDLSDMKILSLSYIFPVNKLDEDKCITKLFDDEGDKAKILDFMYEGISMKRANSEAVLFCKNISDRLDGDFDSTDEMDKIIKSCCLHFQNNDYGIQVNSEASFIKKHLLPFIDEIFLKNSDKNIICAMMDGAEQNGRMPDLKLGYKFKGKPHFAFFAEAKRPGLTSRYQDESDFVKLMKAMKESINGQIDFGFEDPASFGLLIEGYKCILYMMKIKEEGVYVPVMVKRFVLVEDLENAVNIPAIVESFFFVKEKLSALKESFKTRQRNKPLLYMKKESFLTKSE